MKRQSLTLLLLLLPAGCAGRQSPLNPMADQAGHLFNLWSLMLWVCAAMYLLVMVFLGWAMWRARRQLAADAVTPQGDDRGLKLGLGAWAALMAVGLVVLAGASFLTDRALANASSANAVDIRITGQQWWWRIQYRDARTGQWVETANELHLPVDRPARIELVSSDVIHSFWIPNLSGKIDMIPGRVNSVLLTPRKLGWLTGPCTEFCGLQHAQMGLDVKVESQAEFDAWLAGQSRPAAAPTDPAAVQGLAIVSGQTCGMCHSVRGTPARGRAAPDLTHIGSRKSIAAGAEPFSRGALKGWIAQPQAMKPGAEMPATGLSPTDADAVVTYLEGLK